MSVMTRTMISTSVCGLVAATFGVAQQTYPELNKTWVDLSGRVGGRSSMTLTWAVQGIGNLDLVIRCSEDELTANSSAGGITGFHYAKMLSELWIGSAYE